MSEKRNLIDIQWDFMKDVAKLISFIESHGFIASGRELQRTAYQQEQYLKTGKSKTKSSNHLRSLAIDIYIFKPIANSSHALVTDKAVLQPIAEYWKSLSPFNRWGGDWITFYDYPHFERNEPS